MIPPMTRLRAAALAVVAAVAAGCGSDVIKVSEGVGKLNSQVLEPRGARLDCPDEVDGGVGATFDCTMRSTNADASAPVKLKIVERGDDLAVHLADERQFERALAEVTKQ